MPKTEKTEQLFNSIAPTYDKLNHWLSMGVDRTWRQRSLRHIVDKEHQQHILDIACGTGDYSIAIARHSHPDTHIVGLDLTAGMLEVMDRKVQQLHLSHCITTQQGNAEQLPFADGTFDRVTIAFGIRNFEHRETALHEIRRVLKPDGRLVILELSVPENRLLRWGYNLYFCHILPWVGGLVSGNRAAYRYLPASVNSFPNRNEWTATMHACGYRQVAHHAYTFGLCRLYTGEK